MVEVVKNLIPVQSRPSQGFSSFLVKLVIQFFKTSTKLCDVKENDWDLRFVVHSKSVERSREIDLVFERLNWF